MEYRRLGRSGLKISTIGLGSWVTFGHNVDQDTCTDCVKAAFDAQINWIDTADVYALGAAESQLGYSLEKLGKLNTRQRKSFVLATKAFWPTGDGPNDRGLSRKHLFESIDESLERCRTRYMDLYQCHRFDPDCDLKETVHAMEDLVRMGKIHYWGVSVWTGAQMREAMRIAHSIGGYGPISNQPQYSMLVRDIELDPLPATIELGMGNVIWSPMAQGMLTGKYKNPSDAPAGTRAADPKAGQFLKNLMTPQNFETVEKLRPIAKQLGCTLAQLALAWSLHQPGITSAIAGATRPQQVSENAKAADVKLSREVLVAIDRALPPARLPAVE